MKTWLGIIVGVLFLLISSADTLHASPLKMDSAPNTESSATLDLTPEQAAKFALELRGLTTVDMPHNRLAAPLDAGVEESVAYLAMQHVAGESLDTAIRQYGPAPAPVAGKAIE
jgi:hypothetical protein